MALYIVFDDPSEDDPYPLQLASSVGWSEFAAWVTSASPEGTTPRLTELILRGSTADTYALAAEIGRLLASSPPTNPAVADTARGLAEMIGVGDVNETATVTNE